MKNKNVKSRVMQGLMLRFGNQEFTYTDIVKEVLLVNGEIKDLSEYDWRKHRGYYVGSITDLTGYFYKFTKQNPWRLVKVDGQRLYRVECQY
jgi:hypothetical protein